MTVLWLGLMVGSVHAQITSVSGTVRDEMETLIGATVCEVDATGRNINATITDFNGHFAMKVKSTKNKLKVSFMGYKTQTLPINRTVYNITLESAQRVMKEVSVVSKKRLNSGGLAIPEREVSFATQTISTKEFEGLGITTVDEALQGRIAGLDIISNSGNLGSGTTMRLRGTSSISTLTNQNPLIVVNGNTWNVDMSTFDINSANDETFAQLLNVNPEDIEEISVLKDAAATAIYGTRAANGVIVITTKKGTRSGQPKLTYDGYVGVQKTGKRYDVLNSMDRVNLEWDAKASNYALLGSNELPSHVQFGTGERPSIPNYLTQAGAGGRTDINPGDYNYPGTTYAPFSDTNWWDEVDRAAMIQNHQVGLSGGTEKGQYNLSANYFKQDGTVIDSYYQRYQVRANTSFNVRDWLRVGENLTYAFTKDNGFNSSGAESNPYSWTYRASPYVPVYDIAGNFAGSKFAGTGNFQNPVANQKRNKDNYYTHNRVFGNLWAEADIIKGLTFRTNFGLDYTNGYYYRMEKKNPEFSESMGQNNFEEQSDFNYRWVWTNTLTYDKTFNEVHKLTVLLGTEAIRDGLGRTLKGRRYNYLYEDNTNTWELNMGENNAQRIAESKYKGEFVWACRLRL